MHWDCLGAMTRAPVLGRDFQSDGIFRVIAYVAEGCEVYFRECVQYCWFECFDGTIVLPTR